jgi:hypothetical protein
MSRMRGKASNLDRFAPIQMLARKDVIAGLLFSAVAVVGLYVSRDYPVGSALRMGTGYVPRLLCWILLALGAVVLVQGLRKGDARPRQVSTTTPSWRSVVFVPASLVIFGLVLERIGLVLSIFLLIAVGAPAARDLRPLETIATALVLAALSWAIFIVALGLTMPLWPEW